MVNVIPVIDLMHGQVVRGIGGKRDTYRPIVSNLVRGSSPASIAKALATRFHGNELYVADLDAIAGAEPAWDDYRGIAQHARHLWVDAGISSPRRARRLAEFDCGGTPILRVIAGLESIDHPDDLARVVDGIGADRVAFSLDLIGGRPASRSSVWQAMPPTQIAETAISFGIRDIIVLDMSRVGTGRGMGTESICHELHRCHPEVKLTSGGGVASVADIRALADVGCTGVLVASALHDGRLTPNEMREAGLL